MEIVLDGQMHGYNVEVGIFLIWRIQDNGARPAKATKRPTFLNRS